MEKKLSKGFYLETEKGGQKYDLETHAVIFDRYQFAASLSKDNKVLEVGCGHGIGLEYLSSKAESVQAIEYSQENIDMINYQNIGSASVTKGDAHNMLFNSESFDLVVALAMIYYLSFPKFLEEVHRVLKKDGTLFFCTSNKDVPGFCEAPYTTKYYSIPELNSILNKMGFDSEFYGAFPNSKFNLFYRVLYAKSKDFIKYLFELTKIGRQIWKFMRLKSLGKLEILPKKITEENISASERVVLDSSEPNHEYKVIYVTARKKIQ